MSGIPITTFADRLPFWHYVGDTNSGSRTPVDECFALYMNNSRNHSLALIDCIDILTSRIICKRPMKNWSFRENNSLNNKSKSVIHSTSMNDLIRLPVHTLHSQNTSVEYRLLLDLHECPKHSSWYCARHRCAASGGQLAALQNANDFQEVLGNLIHKLKATRAPQLNSTTLLVYLDVHRELYSDYAAATSAENDEPKSVWRWRGGHPLVPTNGLSIITSSHKDNGDESTSLDDASNELCGALRIEWNTSSENHSITFYPMQCSSDPPSPLTASAFCSRVIPHQPLTNHLQGRSNSPKGSSSTHSGTELETDPSTATMAIALTLVVVLLALFLCALSAIVLIVCIRGRRPRAGRSILFCWRSEDERYMRNIAPDGTQQPRTRRDSQMELKTVVNEENNEQRL